MSFFKIVGLIEDVSNDDLLLLTSHLKRFEVNYCSFCRREMDGQKKHYKSCSWLEKSDNYHTFCDRYICNQCLYRCNNYSFTCFDGISRETRNYRCDIHLNPTLFGLLYHKLKVDALKTTKLR
jgi:hypothetical protein